MQQLRARDREQPRLLLLRGLPAELPPPLERFREGLRHEVERHLGVQHPAHQKAQDGLVVSTIEVGEDLDVIE